LDPFPSSPTRRTTNVPLPMIIPRPTVRTTHRVHGATGDTTTAARMIITREPLPRRRTAAVKKESVWEDEDIITIPSSPVVVKKEPKEVITIPSSPVPVKKEPKEVVAISSIPADTPAQARKKRKRESSPHHRRHRSPPRGSSPPGSPTPLGSSPPGSIWMPRRSALTILRRERTSLGRTRSRLRPSRIPVPVSRITQHIANPATAGRMIPNREPLPQQRHRQSVKKEQQWEDVNVQEAITISSDNVKLESAITISSDKSSSSSTSRSSRHQYVQSVSAASNPRP
jgi:hypothetical protein